MKSIVKRSLALVLALVLAACTFTGCGASYDISKYANEVVATYGDQEIYLDEANFYARLQQYYSEALYSAYYGTNFWSLEVTKGVTLEEEGIVRFPDGWPRASHHRIRHSGRSYHS